MSAISAGAIRVGKIAGGMNMGTEQICPEQASLLLNGSRFHEVTDCPSIPRQSTSV